MYYLSLNKTVKNAYKSTNKSTSKRLYLRKLRIVLGVRRSPFAPSRYAHLRASHRGTRLNTR